jgi:murein DD-endopeptidase MepM/ murein hydrolase activator NlpD
MIFAEVDSQRSIAWRTTLRADPLAIALLRNGQFRALVVGLTLRRFGLKKRYYIVLVSRDESGILGKVPVPLHYAYVFVAAAVIGTFTMAGLAGSYSRMLVKTERFNQLRNDHNTLQKDYAHLEKQAHEKDVQAASLGSLATEVSALYGLTASKLSVPLGHMRLNSSAKTVNAKAADAALITETASNFTDDSYYKSLDTFNSLRNSAVSGAATHAIDPASALASLSALGGVDITTDAPSLWPIIGPIRSSFGQREDPVTGNGEGEFHTGIDISAPIGTPIRATADGTVKSAEMESGYGREVIIDHGHGMETCYAHMSGFAVMAGQNVVRGQVIGYVGVSGRTTGAHLHYEVRIHNTPVNPHKYMRETIASMGTPDNAGS